MTTVLLENKVYSFLYCLFNSINKEKYTRWMEGHIRRLGRIQTQQLCLRQHNRFGSYLASHDQSVGLNYPLTGSLFDDSSGSD